MFVTNYVIKLFIKVLEQETGFSVEIIENLDNYDCYKIKNKHDMNMGILCINNEYINFMPSINTSIKNNQYFNNDFINLLDFFKRMFGGKFMPVFYQWKISFIFNSGEQLTAYIKSTYTNSKDVSAYLKNVSLDEFLEFHNALEDKHIFVRMRDVSAFIISAPDD